MLTPVLINENGFGGNLLTSESFFKNCHCLRQGLFWYEFGKIPAYHFLGLKSKHVLYGLIRGGYLPFNV